MSETVLLAADEATGMSEQQSARIVAVDAHPALHATIYEALGELGHVSIITDLPTALGRVVQERPYVVIVPVHVTAPGALDFRGRLFVDLATALDDELEGRFILCGTGQGANEEADFSCGSPDDEGAREAALSLAKEILKKQGRHPERD